MEKLDRKIKRHKPNISIDLTENEDIAAELGASKEDRKVVLFAMETESDITNAKDKLKGKQGDIVVVNNLLVDGAGFGHDTNVVTIIDRFGKVLELPKMSKDDVANKILDCLVEFSSGNSSFDLD